MDRVSYLVQLLEKYSDYYYAGQEIVDDVTFDGLEDELRSLSPNNKYFKRLREKPSPYGTKVNHPYEFIGSLDKVHSVEESALLTSDNPVLITAKLDGASLVTYFKNGKLDKAVTRGDGQTGIDVTAHYLRITSKYKLHIPENFTGAVRGEVVFRWSNWETFKQLHPEAKAPRNSGTGLINQKEISEDEDLLDYIVYDIVAMNYSPEQLPDYYQIQASDVYQKATQYPLHLLLLEMMGYPVVAAELMKQPNDYALREMWKNVQNLYPVDGLVARKLPSSIYEKDGMYHFTKEQVAYKFQAEVKRCTVRDIVWQLGRTGKLTPVLTIDPVEMSGAIVSRITAHNAANVRQLRLGKGAEILAYRSGEVIPTIQTTLTPADELVIPTHCPYCGSRLEWTDTGVDLRCIYEECEGLGKFRVFNYIENICEGIKGVGDVFLELFITSLYEITGVQVNSISTLYKALEKYTIWSNANPVVFSNLGNANTKIALQVINKLLSPELPAYNFYLGLGIRLLGDKAAKTISENSEVGQRLAEAIYNTDISETANLLTKLFNNQQVLIANILNSFNELNAIYRLIGIPTKVKLVYTDTASTPKRYYAITGSLSKSRKLIEQELQSYGWYVTENVANAELLITNTPNSTSSKNKKAKELNKEVITEEEFYKKFIKNG